MEVLSTEYVAGFIDGEGSFGIYSDNSQRNRERYQVSISNTHLGCLELIQKKYGGRIQTKKKIIRGLPHYCFELKIRGLSELRKLVEAVLPFLVVRKEQAKLFLQTLNGEVPTSHAVVRLKAMKRAVNVTNLEAAGVDYNVALVEASRSNGSQG